MEKRWVDYRDQVVLLKQRGLRVDNPDDCEHFLSVVNYYRFSGYFRYWQVAPIADDNRFLPGANFDDVKHVYLQEQKLGETCADALRRVEVMLRTRIAHAYGSLVTEKGGFAEGIGLDEEANPRTYVQNHILMDLSRSKEAFVRHYRKPGSRLEGMYPAELFSEMPIWVAVEAFSFGTLSRFLAASTESGTAQAVAESLGVSPRVLPSQVRSFVYLRNRIAHQARLWNHSVLDTPGLLRNTSRRAKQQWGDFEEMSVFKILVALDIILKNSELSMNWLQTAIMPMFENFEIFRQGIIHPRKYGDPKIIELISRNR